MKHIRFVLVVIVFLVGTVSANAQDGYRVSSAGAGSGQTPISSGISAWVNLTTENGGFMQVMAQSEQGWFMMGKDFAGSNWTCNLYGSIGYFQGAPWVGPYAGCDVTLGHFGGQKVSIGALTWPGFYIGREPDTWRNDGLENPESLLAGYFSTAQVLIGGLSVNISHLDFLDDKVNWLPGVAYTYSVKSDFDINGSMTWNTNADSPMFFIGVTKRFSK